MNEHQPTPPRIGGEQPQPEVRPAPMREVPDWRRLEVTLHRFGDRISAGITAAQEQREEIDHGTARCIAHVLGRSWAKKALSQTTGARAPASTKNSAKNISACITTRMRHQ